MEGPPYKSIGKQEVPAIEKIPNRRLITAFAAVQIAFAIILFVLTIIDLCVNEGDAPFMNSVIGSGIWLGIIFIAAGSFAIAWIRMPPSEGQTKRFWRFLKTALVLSAVSFAFTVIVAPLSFWFPLIAEHNPMKNMGFTFFAIYLLMFIVNLGQLITLSITRRKLRNSSKVTVVYQS
ncbi:uncharacterized protein LOC129588407 [Paramacrobiotus metropolitanus]|uniref:uncharacterized protein LOC129588407 n=1 Tax=Paramacrobiotus metropolitanus TaxID=2943436 RepID=UPI0024458280|nr:uncharacterized protein LOC129588407 [Paramacrobiotus metropolitanus]